MKHLSGYLLILLTLILTLGIFSCEKDDYDSLLNNNASKVGKVQSLIIMSGQNRVLVEGIIEDPNVSQVSISWDNTDSIMLPVNAQDTIRKEIGNLEEGLHVFNVKTIDANGNSSEVVSAGAEVFGSNYINSLVNRPLESSMLIDSTLEVSFGMIDKTTGVIGTEFIYEDTSGETEKLFLDVNRNNLNVTDFNSGSTYKYRTAFIPSTLALDTIYTDYASVTPFQFPVLKNASSFEASEVNGRWGILADWITNDAIKNHDGYGGWDSRNGFNVESGWGAPSIVNGKIYQTVTAGPTDYTLEVVFNANNYSESDEGGYYIVVAKVEGLPDVEDIPTAPEVLGYERVTSSNMTYDIDFTVDETTLISIGIVTTQDDSGRYGPIKSFEILPN
ncbi:hypothetical protein C7S20_10155 [Christiangramia fulva]|uniref:DUF5013 domain-containing protein n=1 Tax=Christiangramia fulva TaxID=2126553 RepID=A0A2R3Z5R9_9FLAO|nr:DUF4998 domain-containing protein [Christiangramia fulva]AVR45599.1 hypothetical protein C7S20_10155 [Christiangramia fulva]